MMRGATCCKSVSAYPKTCGKPSLGELVRKEKNPEAVAALVVNITEKWGKKKKMK